jgi:hypothetical protein
MSKKAKGAVKSVSTRDTDRHKRKKTSIGASKNTKNKSYRGQGR